MNIAQKVITCIALFIMGAWVLLFAYFQLTQHEDILAVFLGLLGLALFIVSLLILVSSKK